MASKEEKELRVLEYFLEHPTTYIKEIAEETGIPRSSVQRYLQKYEDVLIPSCGRTIREQLEINRRNGQREGGKNFFLRHNATKGKNGRFTGSILSEENNLERKKIDIYLICNYYLLSYPISLTDFQKELRGCFTKDYLYDCLTCSLAIDVMGVAEFQKIQKCLCHSKSSYVYKKEGVSIPCEGLTEEEKEILFLREDDLSLEEIGKKFGLSKTSIGVREDKIFQKIKDMKL